MVRASCTFGLLLVVGAITVPAASAWEDTQLAGVSSYYVAPAGIEDEDGKLSTTGITVGGIVPLEVGPGQVLVLGAGWQGLLVDYRDLNFTWIGPDGRTYSEKDLPHSLYSVSVTLGYGIEFDSGFGLFGAFIPAVQSDFEDVGSEDLYYLGGVLANYRFSESFNLLAGLYYADSFGEEQLLPGLGVQWELGSDLRLDAFLPQFLNLEWQACPFLSLGLRTRVVGHEYRMTRDMPWDETVLKYSQVLAGPYADLTLAENLYLRLEAGGAFSRIFEIREKNGTGKLDDGDIDDQAYLSGALFVEY